MDAELRGHVGGMGALVRLLRRTLLRSPLGHASGCPCRGRKKYQSSCCVTITVRPTVGQSCSAETPVRTAAVTSASVASAVAAQEQRFTQPMRQIREVTCPKCGYDFGIARHEAMSGGDEDEETA